MTTLKGILYVLLSAIVAAFPWASSTLPASFVDAPMAYKFGVCMRRAFLMAPAGAIVGLIVLLLMRKQKNALLWGHGGIAIGTIAYICAFTTGLLQI